MTVTDKKLSVEHSLLLLENFENPAGIRNGNYAIYGNTEIGKIWKRRGHNIYYFMTYT